MKISEHVKKEILEVYSLWNDNKNEIKFLNQTIQEALKGLAEKLDCKPKVLSSAFRFMKKAREDGVDELDPISELFILMNTSESSDTKEESSVE